MNAPMVVMRNAFILYVLAIVVAGYLLGEEIIGAGGLIKGWHCLGNAPTFQGWKERGKADVI
jgi:hypothetical protein